MAKITQLEQGMIIDVNLEPTQGSETGKVRPCIIFTNNTYDQRVPIIQVVPVTEWNPKKSRILTDIEIEAFATNGLSKRSIADYLQTDPIDHRCHLVKVQGMLEVEFLSQLNQALKVVFTLD